MSYLLIAEGPDCCGKTTQLKMLKEALEKDGHKVILTREPGGTEVGDEIRKLLLDSKLEMDKMTEAYLFAASRAAHNNKIIEWLNEGYIVLCDRHFITSIVYQGSIARSINKTVMNELYLRAGHHQQDLILFDIDYDTYIQRIKNRNESMDRIEKNNNDEHTIRNIINNYKKVCSEYNAIVIDARKTKEEVHENVLDIIKSIVNN